MFKIMVLIKRREGMSMADFIDYYESHHSVLAAKHLHHTQSYLRHYLTPLGTTSVAPRSSCPMT